MATLNQFSSAYDYSQYYPAGAQYDSASGQYYDPQTGQYYDYSQYYQQYQNDKNTQSKYSHNLRNKANGMSNQSAREKYIHLLSVMPPFSFR